MSNIIISAKAGTPVGQFGLIKLFGAQTTGSFSLVEHPLAPGRVVAPIHTHHREDEYSYVLEGELTALIGTEVFTVPTGTLLFKPLGIPHTVWNGTNRPARFLEIISPAGFECYFVELSEILARPGPPDFERINRLAQKYGLEFDFNSLSELSQKYNVTLEGVN
jgi:mannose-6-phosphate isomerase-like protein (cupin superfamily)